MVVHGDDSPNESPEDMNLGADDSPKELDSLRLRLGRKKEDIEPTRAQLVATGELDDESEENEEEELPQEPSGERSTALTTTGEVSLSIRKQVRKRLLEGATRDELLGEGFNKSTISTVASEVKKETGSRKSIGRASVTTSKGLPIFAKGAPPEAIIDAIEVPDVSNGAGFAFEQGIKFGMSLVTIGIRMAQELSGIGIMQAKPLLDMAKSMREGEAVAAKNAAGEAAMEAADLVYQQMQPTLAHLSRSSGGGEGGDPIKGMMVRTMEPIMQRLLSGAIGKLTSGQGYPQLPPGSGKVEGWERRSE